MGNVAEPDTRHFLTYDVYTHITYAELEALATEGNPDDYAPAKNFTVKKGDSIFSSNAIIIFDSLSTNVDKAKYKIDANDIAVQAYFQVLDVTKKYTANPIYVIKNNNVQPIESTIDPLGLKFLFWQVNPEKGNIQISLQEKKSNVRDFIVMQAIVFPYINILWMGCIIMAIGTTLSILERLRKKSKQ